MGDLGAQGTRSPMGTDQRRQAQLDSSASFVEARSRSATRSSPLSAGLEDDEIARVTGLPVSMIKPVLRTL